MQSVSELYQTDPLRACRLALRQTVHVEESERLEAIDKLLGTYGTEAIRGEWQNGYWCDIAAVYCNAGDTYALTVIQVRGESRWQRSRFIVSTMGGFVERNEHKLGIN